jgi:hypothetical protein
MSPTLRDVLGREADSTGAPDLDLDALVGLGEHHLRRRRTTAALGSAAVVLLVVALTLGFLTHHPAGRGPGPVDHPDRPTATPAVPQPVREIVWSAGYEGTRIHLGDRVVKVPTSHVHLDVTDDGIVFTGEGGELWFSDGGRPRQVTTTVCGASGTGQPSNFATDLVVTANSGSLAVWLDCAHPRRPDLVVLDTGSLEVVSRRTVPGCAPVLGTFVLQRCGLEAVVGDRVYLTRDRTCDAGRCRAIHRFLAYDVTTGELDASSQQAYAEDLRSRPRALLVGDDRQSGEVNGSRQGFRVTGRRLVPVRSHADTGEDIPTKAFDTSTGRAVHLRLPTGYVAGPERNFTLVQWLDDDTVALVGPDILRCRLSSGRCTVAVEKPSGGPPWVLPGLPLPG